MSSWKYRANIFVVERKWHWIINYVVFWYVFLVFTWTNYSLSWFVLMRLVWKFLVESLVRTFFWNQVIKLWYLFVVGTEIGKRGWWWSWYDRQLLSLFRKHGWGWRSFNGRGLWGILHRLAVLLLLGRTWLTHLLGHKSRFYIIFVSHWLQIRCYFCVRLLRLRFAEHIGVTVEVQLSLRVQVLNIV